VKQAVVPLRLERQSTMTANIQEIFAAALALPADNRATLAEKLLESLSDEERSAIDAAWAAEADSRIRAYEDGLIKVIPGEEVFQSLASRRKP
jgi:putative addiction module component (TIGR02574 family)